jgi:6-phosphogluconolactonase
MKRLLFLLSIILFLETPLHAEKIDVYFGTGGRGSKGIYMSKFDTESGKLSQASVAAEINGPGFLAWHPDGTKIYAVAGIDGGPGVAGFHVKEDGSLEKFTTSLVRDGGGTHVAVHPSGKFLLTAQYGGGSTAFFPLNKNGELGQSVVIDHDGGSKVVGTRQNSPHPHWCGFSPDGQYAFVPDLGTDNIHIYKVSADQNSITKHALAASVPGGGPRHMRFSADGKFIYLLNELSLSVTTFAYDKGTGKAKRLTTTPSLSDAVKAKETFNSAAEILVHPNGKFVWSSNRGNDSITCYKAQPSTGKLTVTEVESIRGAWPRNINIDPSSKWIFAAGAHSNTVAVHKIDQSTGKLSFPTRNIISVPGPICVLFGK